MADSRGDNDNGKYAGGSDDGDDDVDDAGVEDEEDETRMKTKINTR